MAYDKYFLSETPPKIDAKYLSCAIKNSLAEDIGQGDITSQAIIPKHKNIRPELLPKKDFYFAESTSQKKYLRRWMAKLNFYIKPGKENI